MGQHAKKSCGCGKPDLSGKDGCCQVRTGPAEAGHHGHEEGETRETLVKILVASVLLAGAWAVEHFAGLKTWQLLPVYLIPYLIVGWETLREAAEGLAKGEALEEDFLMAVATIGALCIGFLPGAEPQFLEAVFVMLFFQVGELFEGIAEGRSRRSIAHLMDIRPDTAHVERGGDVVTVDPAEVAVGETLVIRVGEKIPMDATVLEGRSTLDTAALTGESLPRSVRPGDVVLSGCVNLSGVLRVRVDKTFGTSTAAKILELVEHASESKSRSEHFITRFARIYTPVVVAAAVLLAVVPVLLGGSFATWLYRALTFLIVSCPCALVLSVPLAFFGGIGGASRKGILVKGANWLEVLARLDTVAMDKTGTLTEGVFAVTAVHPESLDATELLHLAAHVERYSTHPIAQSLRDAYPDEQDACGISDVREIAGQGVQALVNGRTVSVGNARMMEAVGAAWLPCDHAGTVAHVAIDGEYAGHIVISDRIKPDAAQAVQDLRACGVRRIVMLTGDAQGVAAGVAAAVGIDEYEAALLPDGKVAAVERLLAEKQGALAFVGDGINDAPVLARADVGIAMGGLGSDAAIEAADVVLMDDKPSKIAEAVRIARRTLRISRQNIVFAIGVKMIVLLLASFGWVAMGLAVFADVGVTVLSVLNSMRTLRG